MVTIDDAAIGQRILAVVSTLKPDDTLLGLSSLEFRSFFSSALQALKLGQYGFRPYSIRRGGACHHLRMFSDLELTLFRGRWGNLKVGRIYLNDGLATWTKLTMTNHVEQLLQSYARLA